MKIVLGVYDGHDAGAAVIHGGKIFAINEERLTREKYYRGFPERSIKEVIKSSGVDTNEIDTVAIAGIYRKKRRLIKLKKNLKEIIGDQEIITVHHHNAHAAGSYFTSGRKRSVILTIDAAGDGISLAVFLGENGDLKKIAESSYLDSLGDFYASVTEMLGFVPMRDEGKVMALGAHYKDEDHHDFADCIEVDGLGLDNHLEVTGSESVKKLSEKTGFPLNRREECSNVLREDKRNHDLWNKATRIAASAQKHLEDMLDQLCDNIKEDEWIKEEFKENICYSGGVAQNVKANKIMRDNFQNSYIFPHMGDGGLALGAALYVNSKLNGDRNHWDWEESLKHVYLGPRFDLEHIETVLSRKDDMRWEKIEDAVDLASNMLTEEKVVGLFQGRMEYGPRALGNRSILADPSTVELKKDLNQKLGREPFQPFSPTILEEYKDEYLVYPNSNKFMTMSFDITERAEEDLVAAVHVDGTCRPQVLEREDNEIFYDIIKKFEEKTGIGAVLNTSFNLHGHPIVCTPEEAIDSIKKIGLDALFCEDYLVRN
ncbi:MAG: carbamoyltransferase [Candidatus Natronoplasma sp.]